MINKNKLISLKDINLTLDKKLIFENLSLNFFNNGITVILGPNGSGKTLLTKVILGLTKIDKGAVNLKQNKTTFGYAPQKITFFRRSVFENLAYPLNVKKYKKKFIVNRIEKLLQDFEISETKKMSARNLSGGISQYISFLRSIVDKPNILILDEPCSNLDNHRKKKIENFLKKNKRKCKIILITHDLFQAQRLADEIIFIENGKILIRSPKTEFEKRNNNKIKKILDKEYFKT